MATYLVTQSGGKPRMVDARTAASAIAHVARDTFTAKPLTMKEAIQFTKDGVELEEVGGTEAEAETPPAK